MTQSNGGVWHIKVMSNKSQELRHTTKEVEVGTVLLGNYKNNVIVNYLLICLLL